MVGTAERLIAGHTALLLRCQKARERRRRAEAVLLSRQRAEADALLKKERDILAAHVAARLERLRFAYEAVAHAGKVDAATLQGLLWLGARLQAGTAPLTMRVVTAEAALGAATASERAAQEELAREVRMTQRRERLAQLAAGQLQRVLGLADELQREDQIADAWALANDREEGS